MACKSKAVTFRSHRGQHRVSLTSGLTPTRRRASGRAWCPVHARHLEKRHLDGVQQDQNIQRGREVPYVIKVVFEDHPGVFEFVVNLCQPGDAWLDALPLLVERNLLGKDTDKLRTFRPWSDDHHVPLQHVE